MKTIVLKKNAGRRFRQGHPWVFSNELEKSPERAGAGEIVRLHQHDGKFLAHGFYHPHSLIAFRVLNTDETIPDTAFFAQKIDQAIALREQVYPGCNARRLVHSESDNLPGLIVDQLNDVLSLQVNSAGMEIILDDIISLLDEQLTPRDIVIRNDTALRNLEGLEQYKKTIRTAGESVTSLISENDLQYRVDVLDGQKTGFFIDQRENRYAFRRFVSAGDRVLDAFCNDGGFSLNAVTAGAVSVDAVDISGAALSRAEHNAGLNGFTDRVQFMKADVMKWLPGYKPENPYDVVNLDPPAFATNRKSIPVAKKAYQKLHGAGMRALKRGGILSTACCSHHITEPDFMDSVLQAAIKNKRQCQLLYRGGPPADHPVLLSMPESGYLKFHVYRVL